MIARVEAFDSSDSSDSSDSLEPGSEFPLYRHGASSYWSVPEEQLFRDCLTYFGTDFQAIANLMRSKTPMMVRRLL